MIRNKTHELVSKWNWRESLGQTQVYEDISFFRRYFKSVEIMWINQQMAFKQLDSRIEKNKVESISHNFKSINSTMNQKV